MPFPVSIAASYLLWFYLPFIISERAACYFAAGLMLAYFYYSVIHHLQHTIPTNSLRPRWMRRRWIDHWIHHGRAGTNYGVTTAFWDHVFGTYFRVPSRIGSPAPVPKGKPAI